MAAPPPLPFKAQKKKNGCFRVFLLIAVCLFALLSIPVFISHLASEQTWEKNRPVIIRSMEEALEAGDHEKALSVVGSYRSREDEELQRLIYKAESLKRKADEQKRQERISQLIVEIGATPRADREAKLNQLLKLDPETKEFPEEISAIREKVRKVEEEARAKEMAAQQAEADRKDEARREQFRKAMEAELAQFKWRYQISPDELTSKPAYHASVQSIIGITLSSTSLNSDF